MKKLFLFLSIIGLVSCETETVDVINNVATLDCLPLSIQDNAIAFYPFNNGSVIDVVSGNELQIISGAQPTTDRDSNPNCAFRFNETTQDDYLTTTDTQFLNDLEEFSVAIWFKLENTTWGEAQNVLISRDEGFDCPDRHGQWSIRLYDGNAPVFGMYNSVWDHSISNFGQWHHLVATYNINDHTIKLYRNGELKATETGIINCSYNTPVTVEDVGDLFIGKYFQGILDDIIIFNIELNDAQVLDVYQMGNCCGSNS